MLEQLGLGDDGDRLVRTYSGGMRRRLDLGASLVGAPRLLLLDEPTTGLDPRSRIELWDAIRALVAAGTDVLLTTQYLEEADQLAAQIVIVDHGRVIAQGTPDELKARAGRDVVEVHARPVATSPRWPAPSRRIGAEAPHGDAATRRVTVPVDGGTAALADAGAGPRRPRRRPSTTSALRRPTLDEVFLALTGRPASELRRPAAA